MMARADSNVLRAENARLLADDIRARRAEPRSLPATVRIETTTECRLSCIHCFKQGDHSGSVMSPELFDRVARELFQRVETVELGFGGEPLHDPHLARRLEAIDPDRGPRLEITTSGDGLESWVGRLVPRTRRLIVSIETLDPSLYPYVRIGSRLQTVLRAVERFRVSADSIPADRRPRIAFRITLFGGNHAILPTLISRLASLGADEVFLHHGVAVPDSHADLQITDRTMDLGVALQRAVLQGEVCGVAVHYPGIAPRPAWQQAEIGCRADGVLPASSPWDRASIFADGTVALCCGGGSLHGAHSVPMGSDGFRVAWASETFQAMRRSHSRQPACGWCFHAEEAVDG